MFVTFSHICLMLLGSLKKDIKETFETETSLVKTRRLRRLLSLKQERCFLEKWQRQKVQLN